MFTERSFLPSVASLPGITDKGNDCLYLYAENGRRMTLTISPQRTAHIYLSRTHEITRKEGTTTALYLRARDIMEEIATAENPIHYTFRADNTSPLTAWAQGPGKEIFQWHAIGQEKDIFIAEAHIPSRNLHIET